MDTKNLDIVYLLKPGISSEELRYSLRSLKNLPHKKVWFYGNKPGWATHVEYVPSIQTGTKWQNTSKMLAKVAKNSSITRNFILMNDDFFVLKPVKELGYFYEKTLAERVETTRIRNNINFSTYSRYGKLLQATNFWLKSHGYNTKNYELHIPMVFNRFKLGSALMKFPDNGWAARRSLYGNLYEIGGDNRGDCKVYDLISKPKRGADFCSTTNATFEHGRVGDYLKTKFKEKCEYEL